MNTTENDYGLRQQIGLFTAIILFIVFLILPSPEGLSPEGWRVLTAAAMMAVLWITEAIPIAVTALLPLVFFPFGGVNTFAAVAKNYANSNIFLFMGGFFIAAAMEKWGLHKRIALHLIYFIGSSPSRIILGFMVATAFLSMWISNTATTMMMYPIGLAIVMHLLDTKSDAIENDKSAIGFRTALMLAIAFSASVGGISTLVGTPPNIVFAGSVAQLYPDAPEIGFLNWLLVGLSLVVLFLPTMWLVLTRLVFNVSSEQQPGGRVLIREEIDKLGKMSVGEKIVAIVFALTALAWITRKDLAIGGFTFHGWASTIGVSKFVHDGTVAMFAALILFMIPVNLKKGEFVLDWQRAVKIPWGILILFGGGIALAEGFKVSGLAVWFGDRLAQVIGQVPPLVMILVVCTTLTFLTEITSNIATTTLFMPILASTAAAIEVHPFLLMIPATISASCAFMLPVATPPNAIIFASGYVSVPQMARAGVMLNLIGIVLVTLLAYLVMIPVFGISLISLPAWVK